MQKQPKSLLWFGLLKPGTHNMQHYIIFVLVLILYSPLLYKLYHMRWYAIDYTHAYFILPVSLWLAFRKRAYLRELVQEIKPGSNLFSLPLLLSGIMMFIFGWRRDHLFISTLSLIPLLFGLVSYLYGMRVTKSLSFPILYLLFLVPPPLGVLDDITLPMRYGVSIAAEPILKLLHYPVTREGLLLSMGGHEIFIGEACSGFRSLITLFSLALVYVYVTKGKFTKKLILAASVIPLALTGNLIRVIAISLIFHHFGEEIGQGFFHYFSGVVIFVIIISGLVVLDLLLGRYEYQVKLQNR